MSTVLERSRDAMITAWSRAHSDEPFPLRDAEVETIALAVIASLREPTVDMLVASLPNTDLPTDTEAARLAAQACFLLAKKEISPAVDEAGRSAALEMIRDWRSMIDAAGGTQNSEGAV